MTAKTDLDNAFSILDAGISAHVASLKAARVAASDETFIQALTTRVLGMADLLNGSSAVEQPVVVPAAVIPTPLPVVAPAPAPVVPQASQVVLDPNATPAMIAAALAASQASQPAVAPTVAPAAVATPTLLNTLEAAIAKMTK